MLFAAGSKVVERWNDCEEDRRNLGKMRSRIGKRPKKKMEEGEAGEIVLTKKQEKVGTYSPKQMFELSQENDDRVRIRGGQSGKRLKMPYSLLGTGRRVTYGMPAVEQR